MYKIIGADQKEYGPVSIELMRQWISEGRVNAQTQAQMVGETTWKPVSMFPEFAANFPPAMPPSSPPFMGAGMPSGDARYHALQEVNGPAIGLIIAAALGILGALSSMAMRILGLSTFGVRNMENFNSGSQNAEMMRLMQMTSGTMGFIANIIGILVGLFIIYGALKMKKLENHGLCIAASIIAMIPCISPCCLIGLPIGIWALVILNKPEIKGAFTG